MIKKITSLFLILVLLTNCNKSDKEILNKSLNKLNSIETVEYEILTQIKNQQMDTIFKIKSFFDFTSNDTLIGSKYHFQFGDNENIFNGQSLLAIDHKKERVVYSNEPNSEFVGSAIPMENSLYEIRNLLKKSINDSSYNIVKLKDTIINDKINFNFQITKKQNTNIKSYNLLISKENYLPSGLKKMFDDNDSYVNSTLSKMTIPSYRPDSIWNSKRLNNKYLMLTPEELGQRYFSSIKAKVGEQAPNWKLPQISNDSLSLIDLKGSLTLLEFWFPNCGGCVNAIPEINNIQKKYSEKGLRVYGIEFTKRDKGYIEKYLRKVNIEYPTLYSGHNTSKDYGVQAAPTFFLIDANGKIIYTSIGLNKIDLENAINKNNGA